jgi:hypothetical protein
VSPSGTGTKAVTPIKSVSGCQSPV